MSNANKTTASPPGDARIRNDYDYSGATPPEFKAGDRVTVNFVTSERNGSKRITGKGTVVRQLSGNRSRLERTTLYYEILLDDGSKHFIGEGMTPQAITKLPSGGKRRKQTRKRKNKKVTRRSRR